MSSSALRPFDANHCHFFSLAQQRRTQKRFRPKSYLAGVLHESSINIDKKGSRKRRRLLDNVVFEYRFGPGASGNPAKEIMDYYLLSGS